MAERGELLPDLRRVAGIMLQRASTRLERRDPSAATQALRWTTPGAGQVADWDAEQAFRFGYLANVIAYRCVQCIVEDITALPFRAGRDPGPQPGFSLDWDPNANLAKFLGPAPGGPAPQLSARKLWAFTLTQRIVTGRMGWELEVKGDDIVAIWPMVSAYLRPVPTEGGAQWFSAYDYGRPDQVKRLPADRVFYGWDPSPLDFRQPLSALEACRYPLSIALMGDQYAHAFLKNGSVPAAMVVTREFANDTDRRKFRQQWAGKYTGPSNAGKTAFSEVDTDGAVGDSIDVKLLGLSQRDAEFAVQHLAALKLVAIDLGVPWSRLDASGRTFDNASEEAKTYWLRLLSIIRGVEDEVNMGLAPRLGPEVGWFDLTGVEALKTKPEPTTQPVGVDKLWASGLVQFNEARAEYGLAPVDGGDRFITADEMEALKGAAAGADPMARVVDLLERMERSRLEVTDGRGAPAEGGDPPDDQREPRPEPTPRETEAERRVRIWSTTERVAVGLERQWERAFRRLFGRQRDATLGRLTGKRGRQAERRDAVDPDAIFDRLFWEKATAEVADDLYDAVAGAAVVRMSETFGIDLDLGDDRVQAFIDARANQLAGQVTQTTYEQIQVELSAGAQAGEDTVQLAERIRKVFDHATRERSVRIARTEVVSAFNGSTAQMAALLPPDVVAGQEWVATHDGRTREHHAGAGGQVRQIGQPFQVGGALMGYPGDPAGPASETVNCRCTLALLTPDEMAEREAALLEGRGRRTVPLELAEGVVAMAAAGRFDERVRARLMEAAA